MKKITLFFLMTAYIFASPIKVGVLFPFDLELETLIKTLDLNLGLEVIKYQTQEEVNNDLIEKKLDVALFYTLDYVKKYNDKISRDKELLHVVNKSHIERMGIYSHQYESIRAIKVGDTVVMLDDVSSRERGIALLGEIGILELDNKNNIVLNPFGIKIVQVKRNQITRYLEFSDFVMLTDRIALDKGYIPDNDALYLEKYNPKYVSVVVTRKKMGKNRKVKKFLELMEYKEVERYVDEEYGSSIKIFNN